LTGDTLKVKLSEATNGKIYTAKFKPATYTVSFISEDTKKGTVDGAGGGGVSGTEYKSVAKAATDYALEGWYDGESKLSTGGDITLTGDTLTVKLSETTNGKIYTAKFQPKSYAVSFISGDIDRGTVDGAGGSGVSGTIYESTARAKANYTFVGWHNIEGQVETRAKLSKTLSSTENGNIYTAEFYPSSSALRFTIVTPSANYPYRLPFVADGVTGNYDLTIYWGDGTQPESIEAGSSLVNGINHAYAGEGEYIISIMSSENDFEKMQMPKVSWKDDRLLRSIEGPLLNTGATDFEDLFSNCFYISSLPKGLFRYNRAATSFKGVFSGSPHLSSLPEDLFSYNVGATDFTAAFAECIELSFLPDDLFKYNTAVTSFSSVFRDCRSLTSLPSHLFKHNIAATDFSRAFQYCHSLSYFSRELFRYNIAATNFSHTFEYCTSLYNIPAVFESNIAATDFSWVFFYNTSLTSLPADLFKNNIAATDFSWAFGDCRSLGSVPADLFKYNTAATMFSHTFYDCFSLSFIPADFFK
ncbi:MAG: InlB B-repeat-containing protein, partial [Phocaeicola sp.]